MSIASRENLTLLATGKFFPSSLIVTTDTAGTSRHVVMAFGLVSSPGFRDQSFRQEEDYAQPPRSLRVRSLESGSVGNGALPVCSQHDYVAAELRSGTVRRLDDLASWERRSI